MTDAVSKVAPYYQQLLGREPLLAKGSDVFSHLSQQRVMVTGAGGSIGSALAGALLAAHLRELVLVEHHENSLFQLRQHLSDQAMALGLSIRFVLADVRDIRTMGAVFQTSTPDVLFHLAAYKHVPLAEECPEQFVSVNVVGTWRLFREARRLGVKKVVYPSTDKAVNPPSVYGATKRSVELLLGALATEKAETQFTVVRLVNVLGACGGVVESFYEQIASGLPVRVTDARMTRYWITMEEALFLLTQGARVEGPAKIVLLDLGEPITVEDIARRLWRLLRPEGEEYRVEYTGIRPGERLSEYLAREDERLTPTVVPGLLQISGEGSRGCSLAEAEAYVRMMEQLIGENARERIRQELFAFVRR